MSEDNVRRLYNTIAAIVSEREKVKVTAEVNRKEESAA